MAKDNPAYVRIRNPLGVGIVADLDTDWSISGLDVKEFPKDEDAEGFVRAKLALGVLEPAGRAEFSEVEKSNEASKANLRLDVDVRQVGSHQEAQIQADAKSARTKLLKARGVDNEEELAATEEETDYSELNVAQLKEQLEARGLSTSGNKDELVARLEEDDEE